MNSSTAHEEPVPPLPSGPWRIHQGYLGGVIGRCVEMHARYYSRVVGFGQFFESQVAAGMAAFASRSSHARNGLWSGVLGDRIVGTIAIDGEDIGPGIAHLRWFIVDDSQRGNGLGRGLLAQALSFCDREGFEATELWTFKGLDAARRLYEAAGFSLVEERLGNRWGEQVVEQRFRRNAGK